MEFTEIQSALEASPELLTELINHVVDTDAGKTVIENRAGIIFKDKIGGEVRKTHSIYDEKMLEKLNERPGQIDGGGLQKTHVKVEELFDELAELRKQKDSLTKEAKVQELETEIERLKKEGGGSHWENTFNTEKAKWEQEKQELETKISESGTNLENLKKTADIDAGLIGMNFSEKFPESVRNVMIETAKQKLLNQSKVEDGKIVYLNENGSAITNKDHSIASVKDILGTELKDILVLEKEQGGGGAPTTIKGSIETTSVDGNDVKQLKLVDGSFKNKTEFNKLADEALMKSGVTMDNPDYGKLKTDAYNRYKVAELPQN